MICKELDPFAGGDERALAGRKAEEQLAFYLRRAFERDKGVHVFNSLRFETDGDAAQIDHLVMHKHGLILVESKSITGQVTVNEHGEWVRQGGGRRTGIPSPILQAERQAKFLRHLLQDDEQLSKLLSFRKQFGALRTNVLVAISDSGIIHRPDNLELPEVCKADQVPDRVHGILKHLKSANSLLSLNIKDTVLDLRPDELERITQFFLTQLRLPVPLMQGHPADHPVRPQLLLQVPGLRQQHAGARALPRCGGVAKIRKSGTQFDAECAPCGTRDAFFTNPQAS